MTDLSAEPDKIDNFTPADFHVALSALGMTQRAFAERWNTPIRTIRHYLNGTRPIPGWVARAVSLELVRTDTDARPTDEA